MTIKGRKVNDKKRGKTCVHTSASYHAVQSKLPVSVWVLFMHSDIRNVKSRRGTFPGGVRDDFKSYMFIIHQEKACVHTVPQAAVGGWLGQLQCEQIGGIDLPGCPCKLQTQIWSKKACGHASSQFPPYQSLTAKLLSRGLSYYPSP